MQSDNTAIPHSLLLRDQKPIWYYRFLSMAIISVSSALILLQVSKKTRRRLQRKRNENFMESYHGCTKNKIYLTIKIRKMWSSCELTVFGVNSCEKVRGRGRSWLSLLFWRVNLKNRIHKNITKNTKTNHYRGSNRRKTCSKFVKAFIMQASCRCMVVC